MFDDEEEIKQKEAEKEKRARDSYVEDLRQVLETPHGRRVLWQILGICRIHQLSFNGNGSETFFFEGKRSIALELMEDIDEARISAYPQMRNEYIARQNQDKSQGGTNGN